MRKLFNIMNISTVILSPQEFDDMPVAASMEEAQANDIPTRWQVSMRSSTIPDLKRWMMMNNGVAYLIEINDDIAVQEKPDLEFEKNAELECKVRSMSLPELKEWLKFWEKRARLRYRTTSPDKKKILEMQAIHDRKCEAAINFFSESIRNKVRPENAMRCALPKKKQRELGMLPPVICESCKHTRTQLDPLRWPTGEDLEVCQDCGMSRTHWEQGKSGWVFIKDIAAERLALEALLNTGGSM